MNRWVMYRGATWLALWRARDATRTVQSMVLFIVVLSLVCLSLGWFVLGEVRRRRQSPIEQLAELRSDDEQGPEFLWLSGQTTRVVNPETGGTLGLHEGRASKTRRSSIPPEELLHRRRRRR